MCPSSAPFLRRISTEKCHYLPSTHLVAQLVGAQEVRVICTTRSVFTQVRRGKIRCPREQVTLMTSSPPPSQTSIAAICETVTWHVVHVYTLWRLLRHTPLPLFPPSAHSIPSSSPSILVIVAQSCLTLQPHGL